MAITLTVLASLLQLHGPGATIESDHQGIDALLSGVREQSLQEQGAQEQSFQEQSLQEQSPQDVQGFQLGVISGQPQATQVYFRRGAFARGPYAGGFRRGGGYYPGAGAFRRAGGYYPGAGAFRRGGFVRGY
ncbi:hypothetical protein [Bradyrhizobium australafricanum]|uniref:hypothetical protein n=1 Tax=Bradyrhizobium australafricanum TaxID=2821406 RepID=UPI001CE2E318|nr:hypothetical protein [Bradyrhizobium australafricanum]MCA6104219.1 hypothetical protein [Bradyrhizobium australafricanum]